MRRIGVALFSLVIVALAIAIACDATATARGWLCAFVLISTVPLGSLALLLVHGVTGGRWGEDLKPVLVPAARAAPLLLTAVLPVLVLRSSIYNWHELGLPDDVQSLYLTPAFFDLRTVAALVIWSALAWTSAWQRQVPAAGGLIAHLGLLSVIPADWVMTLPPGGVSAGFGFGFGCEQIFAALAFAACLAPQGPEPRANQDLVGVMVSALLASIYFIYMQFLIVWYGNVPAKVHWYVARESWSAVALAAFFLGIAIPFLAMLSPHIRSSPRALRVVGWSILAGITLHIMWLTLPTFGTQAALALAPAAVFLAMALIWSSTRLSRLREL
ncbi:MAG: hypothetical protein ACXWIM_18865 [Burkholderiales bacterium]